MQPTTFDGFPMGVPWISGMDIQYTLEPWPMVRINDVFTTEISQHMTDQLLSLYVYFESIQAVGPDIWQDGSQAKVNRRGIFPASYVNSRMLIAQEAMCRVWNRLCVQELWENAGWMGKICSRLRQLEEQRLLLNYYPAGGFYDSHLDHCFATMIYWPLMPQDLPEHTGGELVFVDDGAHVPCTGNSLVIFPGYVQHRVNPIMTLDESDKIFRIAVTQFIWAMPA